MRRGRLICLSAVLLATILISGCAHRQVKPSETAEEYSVRFAVIGDRTGGHQPGIYGQIVEEIQRMKPDFLLTVGDMIEGYTGDTVAVKREWEEYTELLEHMYKEESTPCLWRPNIASSCSACPFKDTISITGGVRQYAETVSNYCDFACDSVQEATDVLMLIFDELSKLEHKIEEGTDARLPKWD